MSEEKKFSDQRWNDTGRPRVVGRVKVDEEEAQAARKQLLDHLKKGIEKEEK